MTTNSNMLSSPYRTVLFLFAALMIMCVWAPLAARSQNVILNGSFENPSISSDEYTMPFGSTLATNGVPDWTFGSSTGNSYDGLVTGSGGLGAVSIESGTNAAFVQGTGSFFQTVTLGPGTYQLSYYLLGRVSAGLGANPTAVSLGDLLSVTNTPGNTEQDDLSDWIQFTNLVTVTNAGSYTLEFAGTIPYGSGDHATFIDNVSLVLVDVILNGSFELTTPPGAEGYTMPFQDNLATNGVPGWEFGSSQGNSYDGILGSALEGQTGVIENGTNCAFDQGTGWFSQTVSLTPGIYELSFYSMARVPLGPDPLAVTLGNLFSNTIAPNNTANNQLSQVLSRATWRSYPLLQAFSRIYSPMEVSK
jgi:hypothetical protein